MQFDESQYLRAYKNARRRSVLFVSVAITLGAVAIVTTLAVTYNWKNLAWAKPSWDAK